MSGPATHHAEPGLILYGCGSPNVHKVSLMLAETGLDHEFRAVSLYDGTLRDRKFRALSPNGRLPVLVDDGEAIFESGAILLHLAEKTGRFLPSAGPARREAVQWLMWQMAGVGPMFGQALHFAYVAPDGNEYARGRYRREVERLYDVAEGRLAAVPYLGGADYGIADIAAVPWLRNYVRTLGIDLATLPAVAAWIARIETRPAWLATDADATRRWKADLAAQAAATPAQRAAFFGQVAPPARRVDVDQRTGIDPSPRPRIADTIALGGR